MSSGSPQPSDEELIRSVLDGNQELFGDLVLRYQGRLVNYLYRVLRDLEEAHDLAQEVFFKVYQALDRYNPEYRFSTWLFRVGQNAAIDLIRKRRLKLVPMHYRDDEDGSGREWEFAGKERDAYGEMRNEERGRAILEAIADLPAEYRDLIELRHFGELSYDEIAKMKNMPLGTVKNKLFRGRQILKATLEEFLSD